MFASPTSSSIDAATRADTEAAQWMTVARAWHRGRRQSAMIDVPPTEVAVVQLYDPADDLQRRASAWRYDVVNGDLSDLARFGAALARAEGEAWRNDRGHIAMRANEDRRFLLGDRILHWAIPWLDAVGRQYPSSADAAAEARRTLLDLAEHHRPAPALSGTEGLVVPGFDGYGPINAKAPFEEIIRSVWSGTVLLDGYLSDLFHQPIEDRRLPQTWDTYPGVRQALEATYKTSAIRWDDLAITRTGSAQLWRDLANRARRTARVLAAWKPYRDISDAPW